MGIEPTCFYSVPKPLIARIKILSVILEPRPPQGVWKYGTRNGPARLLTLEDLIKGAANSRILYWELVIVKLGKGHNNGRELRHARLEEGEKNLRPCI
jgi:hypothetical protein